MTLRPQLRMLRPTLKGLEPLPAIPGVTIRSYHPGDGVHWERIIESSFARAPGSISFDRVMRRDPAFRPERIFFAILAGTPVATASAYRNPELFPRGGTIHYVGTLPEAQGRRLGWLVSLASLLRMAEEGLQCATLLTDDFRLAALKTYLRLGFEPLLVHENQRQRWREVFAALELPELLTRFAARIEGPLWEPPPAVADEEDYSVRTRLRRRDLPGRGVGRTVYGECDALGDESLYHGSHLGRAGCSLSEVEAGSVQPFELWFEAGETGLASGTVVTFHVQGQNPLGTRLQDTDPKKPGYVALRAPAGVQLQSGREARQGGTAAHSPGPPLPGALSFAVAHGALAPGQRVVLAVGTGSGFHWTPVSGRREFKVLLDPGGGDPMQRLPEPVVVRILPASAHHLEAIVPGSERRAGALPVIVSLRDRWDNPVLEEAPVSLRVVSAAAENTQELMLRDGRVSCILPRPDSPACRVAASSPLVSGVAHSNWQVRGEPYHVYFGDLHAHDFTSSAEGYPGDVMQWARDQKALDFVSVALQVHSFADAEKWLLNKHAAEAFLDEGRFVTFPAFEWQHSHYGDKVIHYMGGDQPYLPVDDARFAHPAKLYEAVRGSDALVISHHPGYALDQHVPGTDWDAMETDVDRLVELWSMHGSSEGFDPADRPLVPPRREEGVLGALKAGKRFGFTGGSDTHSGRPGGAAREPRPYWGGLCAVWADALTRRSLFAALWARRTVALTGARIALSFKVNDAWMGEELPFSSHAVLQIKVHAAAEIERIDLLKNGRLLRAFTPRSLCAEEQWEDQLDAPAFYHCRVTQVDGHMAVCSPVWIG